MKQPDRSECYNHGTSYNVHDIVALNLYTWIFCYYNSNGYLIEYNAWFNLMQ